MTDHTNSVPDHFEALLTIDEVAEILRMPVASLRYWRVLGTGPRGFLIGRRLRYMHADVHAWIAERREHDHSAA